MANRLKQRLQSGKACVNGWLAIPSGFAAEVMAQCGWDGICVDLQHGVQDYLSMVGCLQAMQAHPVTPVVRVPSNEPGIVGKVLDAGAMGVICPMINTRAQAEAFVASCRYPPAGQRSNGPIRAALYGQASSYQRTANDEVLTMPMIETQEAVDNLDDILGVPGIDAVYVGPSDLSLSRGGAPVLDNDDPETLAIYDRIIEACNRRGIVPAIHTGHPDHASRMLQRGFRLVSVSNDIGLMAQAATAAVQATRQAAGPVAR
ncbi:MAG: 2,4-dihydroxyhept-2-ene-1,7-dioic acid aldolase [Acetobacteraceae bacterium]|nr:2,4-dihydroxyhept-2-ene-1,7-dioic acid aldolase [Acetobacteraceae bacterium]